MNRILVTGTSGFLGGRLMERALGAGHEVTAVVRGSVPDDKRAGLRTVRIGEICGHTQWDQALEGVTTIIHAAGRAHIMRETATDPLSEFRRVNTDGTRRLAECAARHGVRRVVYISSIKVNGERTEAPHGSFREDDSPRPSDPYGVSKLEAEVALADVAARSGIEFAIVRPPLIYGPGVRANFLSLLRWIDRGLPLPLGAVDNRRTLVSVWNLCDLLLACATHPKAAGQLFLAGDTPAVSTAELVRMLARAMGRPARLVPVPLAALRAAGSLLGRGEQIRRLCDSLLIDSEKAQRLLDWRPAFSLEEGLDRTVRWYRTAQSAC